MNESLLPSKKFKRHFEFNENEEKKSERILTKNLTKILKLINHDDDIKLLYSKFSKSIFSINCSLFTENKLIDFKANKSFSKVKQKFEIPYSNFNQIKIEELNYELYFGQNKFLVFNYSFENDLQYKAFAGLLKTIADNSQINNYEAFYQNSLSKTSSIQNVVSDALLYISLVDKPDHGYIKDFFNALDTRYSVILDDMIKEAKSKMAKKDLWGLIREQDEKLGKFITFGYWRAGIENIIKKNITKENIGCDWNFEVFDKLRDRANNILNKEENTDKKAKRVGGFVGSVVAVSLNYDSRQSSYHSYFSDYVNKLTRELNKVSLATNKTISKQDGTIEKDKTIVKDCPKGCGPLKEWNGNLRCWTCGWPDKK